MLAVRKGLAAAVRRTALGVSAAWLAAGCASRPPPDIPVVPLDGWSHVEGRAPNPGEGLPEQARTELAEGWRLVVEGRLGEADRLLAALREAAPEDPGVLAAAGFLALRSGRSETADSLFERALEESPRDGFAALGSVVAVLGEEDPELVFPRLQRLAAIEPDSPAVTERLPALTLDVAERRLGRARDLARAGSRDPAVAEAYRAALEVVPDSDDLLLEAAEAAAAAGAHPSAGEWFDAVAASPAAGERQALTAAIASADLLAEAGGLSESLSRLDRILAEPGLKRFADLEDRANALERRLEVARLSERYARIREAERVTREQLAALLAAELGAPDETGADRSSATAPVIAIDIERSWAANLIVEAVGAGYLSLFPDHTFKPRAFVRRAELAQSLLAALGTLAPETRARTREEAADRDLTDVPRGHRDREAAAVAVELGLLWTSDGGGFRPRDFASGAEAVRAVHALRDLPGRGDPE